MSTDNFMYKAVAARDGVPTADYLAKGFGWTVDRAAIVQELEELANQIRKSPEFSKATDLLTTKEPE